MHSKVCTAAISAALPESDLISSLAISAILSAILSAVPGQVAIARLSSPIIISSIAKNLSPVFKESSIQVELSYPLILSPPLSLRRSASYLHRSSVSLSSISSNDQLRYPLSAPMTSSAILAPQIISPAILSAPIIWAILFSYPISYVISCPTI